MSPSGSFPLLLVRVRSVLIAGCLLSLGGATAWSGCAHPRATPPPPAAVPPTKPELEYGAETSIPVASTPQGLMREGAEKKIQLRLKAEGLLTAEQSNGQLDMPTRAALRKFQKKEGIPTTGLPSYETVRRLGLDLDSIFHTVKNPKEPAPRVPG